MSLSASPSASGPRRPPESPRQRGWAWPPSCSAVTRPGDTGTALAPSLAQPRGSCHRPPHPHHGPDPAPPRAPRWKRRWRSTAPFSLLAAKPAIHSGENGTIAAARGLRAKGPNARGWRTPSPGADGGIASLGGARSPPVHVCSVWKIKLMPMLGDEGKERSRSSPWCVRGAPCVAQSSGWAGGHRGLSLSRHALSCYKDPESGGGIVRARVLLKAGRSAPPAAPSRGIQGIGI